MFKIQNNRSVQFSIHVIIWGIIAFFPLIAMFSEGERNLLRYLDFSMPIIFLMIVFYTNYFLIISRYLFNKKIWQFFVANLLLFAVCIFLMNTIKEYYFAEYFAKMEIQKHLPSHAKMREIIFYRDVFSMTMAVGLATAIKMTSQWYQSQAEQRELEKLHIESELTNLKNQLNPHFLFNTLNNIYSLISTNQENAQNAVHQLSNLIRYVLYESDQQRVPLKKDLDFTTNYIKLMSLRLPVHVKLETDITQSTDGITIAPLLFMSLVENAFKHGISPTDPSNISVRINIVADNKVQCRVENSNFPKPESDKSGSGIGLNNLRKRLELLYPSAYELNIEDKGSTYISTLTLDLNQDS
jgi:two-component system, LytTR family, sensor histidine kinase AlgZ